MISGGAERPPDSLAVLAASARRRHAIRAGPPAPLPLWQRLDLLPGWLETARSACQGPPAEATKAAEWFLDNEYQVRRAVRQVRGDLPPAFYARLPALRAPEDRGLPRILLAARAFLEAGTAHLDLASAIRFLGAYQGEEGLPVAELWAFPSMLRLACLERIVYALAELLPMLEAPDVPWPGAAAETERDPTEAMSHAIVALTSISRIPWSDFVDATSEVEAILRAGPDGLHAALDFETRDRYRRAVEELARGSGWSEPEVARAVLRRAAAHTGDARRMHTGWWLVDAGRAELEVRIGYRPTPWAALRRALLARPRLAYATALLGFGGLALALPLAVIHAHGVGIVGAVVATVLLLLPSSIPAVVVANWLVTRLLPPRRLPKLDFRDGLAPGHDSAVVLPAIIRTPVEVPPLLAQLERHRLTNPDPRLSYVLLSDLADGPEQTLMADANVERALVQGVRELNRRHSHDAPFVLLHRRRRWNPAEGVWMGWERKRGKLEQFNDFLAGEGEHAFPLTEGDVAGLRAARFVVTLDADTLAPPGSIHRLLGALAHPLNRPGFDPTGERVLAGYTFVQPRIEISPEAGNRSLFARLYTGDTAIDIYSRAVSDVYQDLFGEGIFTGKGAYDVAAFRQCLRDRVPENALVSHDLFEGLHGRAALASDIVLYEGFPARYPDYARRLHRWVRGDWQLLPWLRRDAPRRSGGRGANPLSGLDRWKILDNLRRSLLAPGLVLLAFCGWLAVPRAAPIWTLLTIAAPGSYLVTNVVSGISRGRRRGAVRDRWRRFRDHLGRWLLEVVFMANEAVVAIDAIARALWRLLRSRRYLLEWVTAAHVAADRIDGRGWYWREMAGAPLLALIGGAVLAALAPAALPGAAPLLVLWAVSPAIARWIGRPRAARGEVLDGVDRRYLRQLARRTWLYFETFAGPEDSWLPADNYQARPHEETAHRSSPTNVGMHLLSCLTAHDLGYVGARDLVARTANALDALGRVERYRGHVVNWFATPTLASLEPRYVSTVDSGNLAAALVTLRQGLLEIAEGPTIAPTAWDGLVDVLGLLRAALESLPPAPRDALTARVDAIVQRVGRARECPSDWPGVVSRLRDEELPALAAALPAALDAAPAPAPGEIHLWLERCRHHVGTLGRDLDALFPWLAPSAEVPADLREMLAERLPPDTPLGELEQRASTARQQLDAARVAGSAAQAAGAMLAGGVGAARTLRQALTASAGAAEALAAGMDFGFLYDEETRTFFIGYNVSLDRMDQHRYDLLASEARLASYFAIAKGDVAAEHWFHLGRPISRSGSALTLLSWNGSMFEYLMPALLLRSAPGQLLGQSEVAAVDVQKRYGDRLGLPWGVSEAAFAARDAAHRYQYRAFGVPGLGLKQGLAEDYVVAPYAGALALAVRPRDSLANLRRLEALGACGRYGFYEAVDFTPSRDVAPFGGTAVRAFMAHHQGMLLAAVGNVLGDDPLVRRFGRDRRIAAMDLLLHERVPWEYVPEPLPASGAGVSESVRRPVPVLDDWQAGGGDVTAWHPVGNGRLAVWLSAAGRAALWWHGRAMTRWDPDPGCDGAGARLVFCDAGASRAWEFRPAPGAGQDRFVEAHFRAAGAVFHRREGGIGATQEITVASADDVALCRVQLVNHEGRHREIEVTSLAEPVLAPYAAHERHPAFSKLFIHSEHLADLDALCFTRRPRRPGAAPPVLVHRLLVEDPAVTILGFETERRALLGRHGALLDACAAHVEPGGTAGWTLDPVASWRVHVHLAPGARAEFTFVTAAAGSREGALEAIARYGGADALAWAFGDAAYGAALEAHRLGLGQADVEDAQGLASRLLAPAVRPAVDLADALPGQPDLWGLGLSGDHPIALVRVADAEHADLLPAIVRVHHWLRRSGLVFDLVVLGTTASSYQAPIASRLRDAIRDAGLAEGLGGDGGVHLHSIDRMGPVQQRALDALARVSLDGAAARLVDAMPRTPPREAEVPHFEPGGEPIDTSPRALERPAGLRFDNGLGGFAPDGRSYVVHLEPGCTTPVPWCNVLANEAFGTIVSEAGLGFTWCLNSGEFRLTPWSNDPVVDPQGEAVYLRDEETAALWTPTPLPAGRHGACQVRHAAGETQWVRETHGLGQRLRVCVPPEASVKLVRLELVNRTDRPRRITATYYAEWQLGALPSAARPQVVTGYHAAARALVARNGWAPDFADRIAFLTASRPPHSLSCDRTAFLGVGGRARPAGLGRWNLGERLAGVRDACAAYQVHLDLAPGAREEVVFALGAAAGVAELEALAAAFASPGAAEGARRATEAWWDRRLGAVQVDTPDAAFDLLVNRWLLHQTLASRILARAGFNQASGGVGFRDQLQDMLALLFAEPARVRAHLLACAAHQFEAGDVLHWWHPPGDRGVRTRCSDDLLWLVYATHRYVAATGDSAILGELVPFLAAPRLSEDEEDRYAAFPRGSSASLFDHCTRALERGLTAGAHGLPLIGAGDWNDGMDRVGHRGRGESVWLAWFAAACSDGLAELAGPAGRPELAGPWRRRADALRASAERAAWDGAWYVRAFDDTGEPWGSQANEECRVDSIAQSWAVLAGAPDRKRAEAAVRAAAEHLVDRELRIVRLLTPPFDRTPRDPGYIRAYPPGVRENGGQYTHAATWLGLAYAALGDGAAAYEIFDLINPIRRSATPAGVARYRGEPWVMPADVGGEDPFAGRVGWNWYTGAAAWAWRLAVEGILGLTLVGGRLRVAPCLPPAWAGCRAVVRGPAGSIAVELVGAGPRDGEGPLLEVEGRPVGGNIVSFPSDGTCRRVRVLCPRPQRAPDDVALGSGP